MITFLTRPIIPFNLREVKYSLLQRVDKLRGRDARRLPIQGGHPAINRSLFEGLAQLNISYNVDPRSVADLGDTLFCIADPRSIWQGIRWKRRSRIKKLFAGFATVGTPFDAQSVILNPELDRYVCFSEWHLDSFDLQAPGFREKAVVCPVGVDPQAWKTPDGIRVSRGNVIFYKKRAPQVLYKECIDLVRSAGFSVEEILYGEYQLADYASALRRNAVLVHWNNTETQGISMAEAWAANVPTFVYDPREVRLIHDKEYTFEGDASPYLTAKTGRFFQTAENLLTLLQKYRNLQLDFGPRTWVLENLTDRICAERLSRILSLS